MRGISNYFFFVGSKMVLYIFNPFLVFPITIVTNLVYTYVERIVSERKELIDWTSNVLYIKNKNK